MCKIAGGKLLYSIGSSAHDDLEGWEKGWDGREVQEGREIYIY